VKASQRATVSAQSVVDLNSMLTFAFVVLAMVLFGTAAFLYVRGELQKVRDAGKKQMRRAAVRIRELETITKSQAETLEQITVALREQKQINIPSKSNFSKMEDRYEQAAAQKVPTVNGQPVAVGKAA
jgi:hypothetical protein